eukprot:4111855-Alexandrium_andersonii.AAC.1
MHASESGTRKRWKSRSTFCRREPQPPTLARARMLSEACWPPAKCSKYSCRAAGDSLRDSARGATPVSYTHLRAHETSAHL